MPDDNRRMPSQGIGEEQGQAEDDALDGDIGQQGAQTAVVQGAAIKPEQMPNINAPNALAFA